MCIRDSCRDVNDLTLHSLYKRRIFSLRVNDNDIGIRICENNICHFFFRRKGFSCSRHTENKRVAVEQIAAVSDNHIFADNILTVVNAVFVMNFLYSERNKYLSLIHIFDVSVDEYIFPNKEVKKSSVRRRLDAQLDNLDDKELSVIEATVNGLCKAKEPEE